jgi:hypothetical protein
MPVLLKRESFRIAYTPAQDTENAISCSDNTARLIKLAIKELQIPSKHESFETIDDFLNSLRARVKES